MKPFIKWAGGKRWLLAHPNFQIPPFEGRYIEPFLGGGAIFFHLAPRVAILSDANPKLITTYQAVKNDWRSVVDILSAMQERHSSSYYYAERERTYTALAHRAAQFLYLNRTCYNGLYRENLAGRFNVPIGTKTQVIMPDDDFEAASKLLQNATLAACDFEETLMEARKGDLVFLDPPYTTAHNVNGFIKYNQKIFSWRDQERLKSCVVAARDRGARIILTNANHSSILSLYETFGSPKTLGRASVISGSNEARTKTTEALYII